MARYFDGERWVTTDDDSGIPAGGFSSVDEAQEYDPFNPIRMRSMGYLPDIGLTDTANQSGAGGQKFGNALDYYRYLYGDAVTPEEVGGQTWYKTPNGADAILPGRTPISYNPPDSKGFGLTLAAIAAMGAAGLGGFGGTGAESGWTSGYDLPMGGFDGSWGVNPGTGGFTNTGFGDIGSGTFGIGDAGSFGGSPIVGSGAAQTGAGAMSGWGDIFSGISNADLLKGGLSLASGLMGSSATDRAADAATAASGAAIGEQRRQYDQTRADQAPFMQTGVAANRRLAALLGIDPAQAGAAGYGDLTRRFTMADRDADPVYQSGLQFGLDEGTKAINARAVAGGGYDSGATLKALTRFANDYGTTKAEGAYNRFNTDNTNIYNRLAGVSGAGQTATNTVTSAGANMANNIGNLETGAGNARAAGIVGGANAWGNALGGIGSAINDAQTRSILERVLATRR